MFRCELERKNPGETFYRYEMDGNMVWFSQDDNGSIYSVYVSGNEKLKGIEIHVNIECDPYCYPKNVYMITDGNRFYGPDEVDKYIEKLQYAKELCNKIAEIFNSEVHRKEK